MGIDEERADTALTPELRKHSANVIEKNINTAYVTTELIAELKISKGSKKLL